MGACILLFPKILDMSRCPLHSHIIGIRHFADIPFVGFVNFNRLFCSLKSIRLFFLRIIRPRFLIAVLDILAIEANSPGIDNLFPPLIAVYFNSEASLTPRYLWV
jgi:uncharacterized membrane protein